MTAAEAHQSLELLLKELEESGTAQVSVPALRQLLASGELEGRRSVPLEFDLERHRAQLTTQVADRAHFQSFQLEAFRQAILTGQNAISQITLVNGGSAVALLAFLGSAAGNATGANDKTVGLTESLTAFATGVGLAAFTAAATYVSQSLFAGENSAHEKWGRIFRNTAIAAGLASIACFFLGVARAYSAFRLGAP